MTAKTDTASTGTDTLNEENRSGDSSGKGDVNNSEKLDSISNQLVVGKNHNICFVGNLNTTDSECYFKLKREISEKVAPPRRIDMKQGFAFIHFETEQQMYDCIRIFQKYKFLDKEIRIERATISDKQKFQFDNENFKKPSSTLFVVNFDPLQTKESDLKEHFETFGKTSKITIRNNGQNCFAFVDFEKQEDAVKAFNPFKNRELIIQYHIRRDPQFKYQQRYGYNQQSNWNKDSMREGWDRSANSRDQQYGYPDRDHDHHHHHHHSNDDHKHDRERERDKIRDIDRDRDRNIEKDKERERIRERDQDKNKEEERRRPEYRDNRDRTQNHRNEYDKDTPKFRGRIRDIERDRFKGRRNDSQEDESDESEYDHRVERSGKEVRNRVEIKRKHEDPDIEYDNSDRERTRIPIKRKRERYQSENDDDYEYEDDRVDDRRRRQEKVTKRDVDTRIDKERIPPIRYKVRYESEDDDDEEEEEDKRRGRIRREPIRGRDKQQASGMKRRRISLDDDEYEGKRPIKSGQGIQRRSPPGKQGRDKSTDKSLSPLPRRNDRDYSDDDE